MRAPVNLKRIGYLIALTALAAVCFAGAPPEPGLLFYLSGDHGTTADYSAGGTPEPNFLKDVKIIPNGAKGPGFQCEDTQLLSYWAPGNVYAERGTLALDWRSRYPVGKTAFPIFRVGYADHSSWDMVFLRIDYNGEGGFDAFVTDASLARVRVSYKMPAFPKPEEWVHLAFSWDENVGVRLYVNGVLAAKKDQKAVLYAGLDQFGPHGREISPMQVQTAYNFIRGGDIDELRIYDRMLSGANIASVQKGVAPKDIPALARDLGQPAWRTEWWVRYGWNRPGDVAPYIKDKETAVRKVEIHDVFDLKRWWWKATDGIRETTWPGVYNRSRLAGRNDYFQLPDWDCYTQSGKAVTFFMPDEPWNQLEISGAAWGSMFLDNGKESLLFKRPKDQEKTFHRFATAFRGQKIRFENVEQETPIGELVAYNVTAGQEPKGTAKLTYTVTTKAEPEGKSLEQLVKFIDGRYAPDERATLVALPAGAAGTPRTTPLAKGMPIVHVVIPGDGWAKMEDGLDGIAIDLPALKVKATHGGYFPLNLQVKDPIWPLRNMLDFTFSVKPGEARTLWLDLRDRILPADKGIYLSIAGAGADFQAASLEGAQIRLVFKPRAEAAKEHVLDRFTQARDLYAQILEEHSNSPKLNLYNRFQGDLKDVLRVDPNHFLARTYMYDQTGKNKPEFKQPAPPDGVPLWAFRQVEQLKRLKQLVVWYIDKRQIEDGEFGGGLSDDGDWTNWWPGLAFMGEEPEKVKGSLLKEMDAFYNQKMFTNGLSTIQADELHSYEEGIQCLGQSLLLDFGDPKQLERAMVTAKRLIWLTGVNSAGHRHIQSAYFNGLKMSTEHPWNWSKPSSYLVFQPAMELVLFNGNPTIKKLVLELADGLLAHRAKDASGKYVTHTTIQFQTDKDDGVTTTLDRCWPILWASWRWTGDSKYLEPLRDLGPQMLHMLGGNAIDMMDLRSTLGAKIGASAKPDSGNDSMRHLAWQLTGNKRFLETLYARQIEASALREFINTEGSPWIDRVVISNIELQRARLGGVALARNFTYPGQNVSWKFQAPATGESAAILIPNATPQSMKIILYNLEKVPVKTTMTGWDVEPGKWEVVQGIDTNGDDTAEGNTSTRTVDLQRTGHVEFTLVPRATTVITLKLASKGTPYWERPDLGISREDVKVQGGTVTVKVHSLGSVDAPATTVALVDKDGKTLATASVPAIKAPLDLAPKTADVSLTVPSGARTEGSSIVIDPEHKLGEITRMNNRVTL